MLQFKKEYYKSINIYIITIHSTRKKNENRPGDLLSLFILAKEEERKGVFVSFRQFSPKIYWEIVTML